MYFSECVCQVNGNCAQATSFTVNSQTGGLDKTDMYIYVYILQRDSLLIGFTQKYCQVIRDTFWSIYFRMCAFTFMKITYMIYMQICIYLFHIHLCVYVCSCYF